MYPNELTIINEITKDAKNVLKCVHLALYVVFVNAFYNFAHLSKVFIRTDSFSA